jgi:hypothetical protein
MFTPLLRKLHLHLNFPLLYLLKSHLYLNTYLPLKSMKIIYSTKPSTDIQKLVTQEAKVVTRVVKREGSPKLS